MKKGREQTFNTICFVSKCNIPFISLFLSLNPCLSAPGHMGVVVQPGDGLGWLPWGWPALQRCSPFTKGKSQLLSPRYSLTVGEVLEEYLSELNTAAAMTTGHRSDNVFVRGMQLHTTSQEPVHEVTCYKAETAWDQIPKSMGFLFLYKTCWALGSCSPRCLRISVLCGSTCLLKSQPPKPGRNWKGHHCPTNCWVEWGNNAKLPSVTSHHCTNTKTFTRYGKHPNGRLGRRHGQSSGPSLQRRHQEGR